jgi:hypothetical protein
MFMHRDVDVPSPMSPRFFKPHVLACLQVLFIATFAMTVAQNQQNLILGVYFTYSLIILLFPNGMLLRFGPEVVFSLCIFSVLSVTFALIYQVPPPPSPPPLPHYFVGCVVPRRGVESGLHARACAYVLARDGAWVV